MLGDRVSAQYRVIVEQDEDGVFVAEVLANIKDAIAGYLSSLRIRGEPVPPGLSEEVVEVM